MEKYGDQNFKRRRNGWRARWSFILLPRTLRDHTAIPNGQIQGHFFLDDDESLGCSNAISSPLDGSVVLDFPPKHRAINP
jgi:hypothetical protein